MRYTRVYQRDALLRNIRMARADVQRAGVDLQSRHFAELYCERLGGFICAALWFGVITENEYDALCEFNRRLMRRFVWESKS